MIGLLRSFVLFIIVFGSISFIAYQIIQFILSINNGRSRLEKETVKLRNKLNETPVKPIPFHIDELKILSGFKIELNKSRNSYIGTLNTIYSETLVKFGQTQLASTRYTTTVVQLSKYEIVYLDFNDHVKVLKDGVYLGSFDSKGVYKSKDQQINVSIDLISKAEYLPINMNGKELGQIINPIYATGINSRAFQFLRELDSKEEEVFVVVSLYFLLQS